MVEGGSLRNFFLNSNFREFPQPVSLSFSGQNSRGYIPATPGCIDIKFTEHVDTLSGCRKEFSKSGVTPKFGPQGGSNFQVGPHYGPSSGQIYANIAIVLRPFGRTLNPLKNSPLPGMPTPYTICTRGPRTLQLLLNVAFSGGPCPETVQRFGSFLHRSYREQSFV